MIAISPLCPTVTGTGAHARILANGFGTTHHTSRHVADAFAPRCRVVRCDYLGTPACDLAHDRPERTAA